MSEKLAAFIAALAEHTAQERGWSFEDAVLWVQFHLDEARAEYRAKGAPLGDTEEGFLAWLSPRHQPPAA